jgi:hypothetical protein
MLLQRVSVVEIGGEIGLTGSVRVVPFIRVFGKDIIDEMRERTFRCFAPRNETKRFLRRSWDQGEELFPIDRRDRIGIREGMLLQRGEVFKEVREELVQLRPKGVRAELLLL